jgi:trans-aconitate methyltransferase
MTLNPLDLQHITGATLKHYNEHAEAFWQGTRDHDVSQNIEALLTSIEGEPPFTILDFGCGPGRDSIQKTSRERSSSSERETLASADRSVRTGCPRDFFAV